jgi:tellurite resistance protein TehA-like permease
MFTRLQAAPDAAFGGWLMPVVPPMVSAATGALLVPHLPAGQFRLTMLLACYAMFGLSSIASLMVITQLWRRLIRYSVGPAAMMPTLWGFAALWAGLATALTLRAGRHQLPFGLTWWSFTFPVGTCVTGTSGLALHTGADAFLWPRWPSTSPLSPPGPW